MYITTVDNYQGEENKIILLSLVRNNGEGNIGFLREENRVCVSLSRAREGLYIMGNIDDLVIKNKIWPKLKKVLENQNAIGDSITLRCQIHHEQTTKVSTRTVENLFAYSNILNLLYNFPNETNYTLCSGKKCKRF